MKKIKDNIIGGLMFIGIVGILYLVAEMVY